MSAAAAIGGAFVGAVLLVCATITHLAMRLMEHIRWREKEHQVCASEEELKSLLDRVEQNEAKVRQLQMAKLSRRT